MYEKGSTDVPYTAGAGNNTTAVEEDEFGAPPFRRFRFIYFILLSVLATCGSVYLFLALLRKGFFKIHFYLFVGHLSIIYFIFGIFIIPFYIAMFTLEGYWPFGVGLCITFNIVHNVCVYEMLATVVLIAADRLWAMQWPHHYRAKRTFGNMVVTLGLSWIYCCFTVFPTVIHDRITQSYAATVCDIAITPNFQYWTATITMGFLIPSVLALCIYGTIFYIALVRIFRKRSKVFTVATTTNPTSQVTSHYDNNEPELKEAADSRNKRKGSRTPPHPGIVSGATSRKPGDYSTEKTAGGTLVRQNTEREQRVLFVMLVVMVNFIVCLLPYATYCVLWFYNLMAPNRYFFTVGHLLLFSHPVLDTFAFIFTNKELRQPLRFWK
ncbi:alpha-2Da adrenergic receptor-like [Paramacrobiotus metropolitanus]|uniref:alpha-2Da adrenergic receptor-like n=1 Tax=Paramacrobiotus metropolitanus TaxID=2943436 RepID=UPI002446255E|nr:alpha-2Da adrenergic receptor-like [Paramacrobiotus metropolitanus]XP_055336021.1 alpha-2Da adrenergic receptor-like [Paramacrobiotus metropolitanus]